MGGLHISRGESADCSLSWDLKSLLPTYTEVFLQMCFPSRAAVMGVRDEAYGGYPYPPPKPRRFLLEIIAFRCGDIPIVQPLINSSTYYYYYYYYCSYYSTVTLYPARVPLL